MMHPPPKPPATVPRPDGSTAPDPMTSKRTIPTICTTCAHAEDKGGHYLICAWRFPDAIPRWFDAQHGSTREEILRMRTRTQPAYQEFWQCGTYQPKAQEA